MQVTNRDLSMLARHMQTAAPDPRTGSMLSELADRYQREPDKPVESRDLYAQALRMTEFGNDGGAKIKLGRSAMQFLSQRTACQVAAGFCIQAAAAMGQYDSELAIYRTALKQPEAFEANDVAKLGLEMMNACQRFQIDHARIGELACRSLSDRPEAGEALKQAAFHRTHNQDAEAYKEALTRMAAAPTPAATESAPAPQAPPSYLSRLDRVSGVQASYDKVLELFGEANQPITELGARMLDKCNDYKVCLLVGRTILEDVDQGQTDQLATLNRVLQTLSVYPTSPMDKGMVAEMALATLKGKLENEPLASMAAAAASQTSTFLAQFEVCKAALQGMSESPRPTPSALGERMMEAAGTINAKSASRAGQAAVQAIAVLFDTPEVKNLASTMEAELDASSDYKDDLPAIRKALQGLGALPAPAQGSLLAMAKATAGLGETAALGEQNGAMVVGGVRLKVKKREWEGADAPKS